MLCIDCGNTTDFRVEFTDWVLLSKQSDGTYAEMDNLAHGRSDNPIECHDCSSHNIREDV